MKNVRVTKAGTVILAVLAAAVVVSLVTTGGVRVVAAAVMALVVSLLVGEGVSGYGGHFSGLNAPMNSEAARKREVLTRDAKKRRFDP